MMKSMSSPCSLANPALRRRGSATVADETCDMPLGEMSCAQERGFRAPEDPPGFYWVTISAVYLKHPGTQQTAYERRLLLDCSFIGCTC